MPGKRQCVNPHIPDVDGNDPRALGGIQDEIYSMFLTDLPDFGHRLDGANDIGAVIHDHHFGVFPDLLLNVIRMNIAMVVEGNIGNIYRSAHMEMRA